MKPEKVLDILQRAEKVARLAGDKQLGDEIHSVMDELVPAIPKKHSQPGDSSSQQTPSPSPKPEKPSNPNQEATNFDERELSSLAEDLKDNGPPMEFYQTQGDDMPFCPQCWNVDKAVVKLIKSPPQASQMGDFYCPRCEKTYGD